MFNGEKPLVIECGACGHQTPVPDGYVHEYISSSEACAMIGETRGEPVSMQRVDRLMKDGRFFPIAKRGRNRYIRCAQVADYIAARDGR